MLVVLLILLVATASAAVSVSNTQIELQSAGNERVATQTRYVAESAIVSTMAWVDQVQDRFGGVLYPARGNELEFYAEPELRPGKDLGMVTIENVVREQDDADEVAPLNDAPPYSHSAGAGGAGGAGGTVSAGAGGAAGGGTAVADTTGSFGPEQSYALTNRAFVVHFTDCVKAQGALVPGEDMSGGPKEVSISYHCVLTARGRLEPAGGSTTTEWEFGTGGKAFLQRGFASAHDARATIITPSIMQTL